MGALAIREGYGRGLAEYGLVNPNVVVLDADTSGSTFSSFFAERFPDRFYNIGIAEPCMVDVAVGLALGGAVPFVNAFAAILSLRAMEQIRTCVCYARTNVKLASSYAGLSDFKDGPTHHAITDIALMRALPEMTVIVPADAAEAARWVPIIAEYDGPVYLRLSRGSALPAGNEGLPLEIGRGLTLREGQRRDSRRHRHDGRAQPARSRRAGQDRDRRARAGDPHGQTVRPRADLPGGRGNRRAGGRRGALDHRRAGRRGGRGAGRRLPGRPGTGGHRGLLCPHRTRPGDPHGRLRAGGE